MTVPTNNIGSQLQAMEARLGNLERLLNVQDRISALKHEFEAGDMKAILYDLVEMAREVIPNSFVRVLTKDVFSPCRTADVALVRQVCMFVMRVDYGVTLEEVGRWFNRDHGTVLHAVEAVNNRAEVDKAFATKLQSLRERINPKKEK